MKLSLKLLLKSVKKHHNETLIITCEGEFTWRRLVSAVPESSAGPPRRPSPPRVGDACLPVLCAGPPGSFSFARDASGAAGMQKCSQRFAMSLEKKKNTTQKKQQPPPDY